MIGNNIREEAQKRINLAKNDYDINAVITKENITILNDIEDHLNTIFVCEMAEKLIYEAAYMTCGAAMVTKECYCWVIYIQKHKESENNCDHYRTIATEQSHE
jgi:hypothetical protein